MIRFSGVAPHMLQYETSAVGVQIDRAQTMTATKNLNKEPNREIGTDGIVDFTDGIAEISYTLTQKEPLTITTFQHFAGKSSGSVSLSDFRTPATDIFWFLTDDDASVTGTLWYPKLRMNGFSISVSDPQSQIERSFDLVGELAKDFQGTQKYLNYKVLTVGSGELDVNDDYSIAITDPEPVEDERNAGYYIIRSTRIRSGVTTIDMDYGTADNEYTYTTGTTMFKAHEAIVGDVYKVFYTAAALPAADSTWTANTADVGGTPAFNISAWIGSASSQLTRVQGLTIDVSLDRADEGEIGNKEKVTRGSNDETVTITIPRKLEDFVIDEVLVGQASGFGHIDIEDYLDNVSIVVKIYAESAKTTFKWGLKIENCSPTEVGDSVNVQEYSDRGTTLESRTMTLSDTESDINF